MSKRFSTDPAFYLDLLQFLASFLSANPEEFDLVEDRRFGIEMVEEAPRVFCGGRQAKEFVRSFSFHDQLFSNLAMNPLFGRADITPSVLASRAFFEGKQRQVTFSFKKDGTLLEEKERDLLYAFLRAPRVVYHALYMPILRICEFQTLVATFKRYPQRLAALSREADPWEPESPALILYKPTKYLQGFGMGRFELWTYDLLKARPSRLIGPTQAAWFWQAASVGSEKRRSEDESSTLEGEWNLNSTAVLQWAETVDEGGFADSGLLRIPVAKIPLKSQLSTLLFLGSPDYRTTTNPATAKNDGDFVFIDRHYQALLPAQVDAQLGPIYTSDISGQAPGLSNSIEFLCARENRVEIATARTFGELRDAICRAVPRSAEGRLLFRGQTRHYEVQRTPLVKSWLYGNTQGSEVSLQTGASRNAFPYDDFFGKMQLYLQGLLYERLPLTAFKKVRDEPHRQACPFADEEVHRIYRKWMELYGECSWDLIVMGLAQHYGVPTHGLDLTADLAVAAWFAVHSFVTHDSNGQQFGWYKPLEEWRAQRSEQPVVYVVEIDGAVRRRLDRALSELTLPRALRVDRQSAYLHYGGWGLQANACAEDVRMAVFLEPGFHLASELAASHLFPDEDADPFYAKMLSIKRLAILDDWQPVFASIVEYLNPLDEILYNATNRGEFKTVHNLLDRGAGVNYRDRSKGPNIGLRPLHWASLYGEVDLVRRFLEHGSIVDARDDLGRSALVCAAMAGKREVVKVLLEHGARISDMNYEGWRMIPRSRRSREVVEVLSKYGYEVERDA